MKNQYAKQRVDKLLSQAGIAINGDQPWDIKVNDDRLFARILISPSLGAGEAYMDGWWDCERLDILFDRFIRNINLSQIYRPWSVIWALLRQYFTNQQSRFRAKTVAKQHYNLGNDLYEAMLGESMAYTCGYWATANELTAAQQAKYDLICRKLALIPGEKVLELGCGFGGFAKYAAQHYGVQMTSVNISTEQMKYAKSICTGLPVQLYTCDYRHVEAYNPTGIKFDKVVSIGMCEHVGRYNYEKFLKIVRQNLKTDGLFLLHTIGKNNSLAHADPWMQKYIFPNGMLPTLKWLSQASEGKFIFEDVHNFSVDYDKTLMAWDANFTRAWPQLKKHYNERFYRMWRYYLLSCAGAFRARSMQLWQIVLSPNGVDNGYKSVR